MPDGTRVRKNFRDKADAVRELADLEQEYEGSPEPRRPLRTLLSAEQLSDAESAIQQIGEGASLSQIVAQHNGLRARAEAKGVGLEEAMAYFEAHYRPETEEVTILNAKEEFMRTRQHISESTRANYDNGLSLLLRPDPNKFVHSFTVSDIEAVLANYRNLHSKRSFRTIFSIFFRWAVRHHYCLENPCDRLDKLPRDMSRIAVLSLDEVKRLLQAAMLFWDGSAAPAVAIGLFAGLRPSEIRDLAQQDIVKGKIRVSGGKMRRKLKRSVPIVPVLAEWLREYPFEGLPNGWDYKLKVLRKTVKPARWVKDIIRHTSITFQTERDRNEALTAYNCGTSIEMMNRHYRETVDDERTVGEFWSLSPAKIRAGKLRVELPDVKRVEWPSKARLVKLVWKKPLLHAAAELGVSDVALKKRCVKLGIDLPPRGYWLRR